MDTTLPTDTAPAVWAHTLANGLRIWGETRPHSHRTAVRVVVGAGSRHAPKHQDGVPHFVEHMVFCGSEQWSEAQLHAALRDRAGVYGASTAFDAANYWAQTLAAELPLALEWLAQVVFHPTFPKNKIAKECQVIAAERDLVDPGFLRILRRLHLTEELQLAIETRLTGASHARGLGDDGTLANITRDDLVEYHWQRYTPGNAGLVVVGPAPQADVVALVEQHFGALESRVAPVKARVRYPRGPHNITVRGPVERHHITVALGARTVGCAHPDRWPLEVLAEVLSQRLLTELRFRRGLTYTPFAYNLFLRDTGFLSLEATVQAQHEGWAIDTLRDGIERVKNGEVKKRAVRTAAAVRASEWAAGDENHGDRAETLGDMILDWPADAPPPDVCAALEGVTRDDLARVAQHYDVPERRFHARHVPVFALDSVEAGLADGVAGAKRLALVALGAGAVHFMLRRAARQ